MKKAVLTRQPQRTAVLARERGPENAGAAVALPQRPRHAPGALQDTRARYSATVSAVTAVTGRDYSVVMALTVLLALIVIIANMVVDILYGFLDPRTRDARA